MGNAKRRMDSGIAAKTRNPLRIKVFWECAESREEEVLERKSARRGKVCRPTGQLFTKIAGYTNKRSYEELNILRRFRVGGYAGEWVVR